MSFFSKRRRRVSLLLCGAVSVLILVAAIVVVVYVISFDSSDSLIAILDGGGGRGGDVVISDNEDGYYYKSKVATTSTTSTTSKHARKGKRRIVLLAGPHKTGSTSIQRNLVDWIVHKRGCTSLANASSNENNNQNWAWPLPIKTIAERTGCTEILPENNNTHFEQQGFMNWIRLLLNNNNNEGGIWENDCLKSQSNLTSAKEFLQIFKDEFYERFWNQRQDLVIATEAMDWIQTKPQLLKQIIDQLPLSLNNNKSDHFDDDDVVDDDTDVDDTDNDTDDIEITAVVTYRTPRVDHLISMWHQCCMDVMTFCEFIPIATKFNKLQSINSLNLVKMFLEYNDDSNKTNLKVILIDMEGINEHGYDISNVVACDILNATCNTTTKTLIGGIGCDDNNNNNNNNTQEHDILKQPTKKQNVRTHSHEDLGSISQSQLQKLDTILKQYDCDNFYSYLMDVQQYDDSLAILYNHGLQNIFDECHNISSSSSNDSGSNNKKRPKMTMERLSKQFSGIVTQDWIC